MNIEAYQASGILERYTLGLSTPEENWEVESLAALHPALRSALDSLSDALETYAKAHALAPPARVKDALFKAIHETETNSIHPTERGRIIPLNRKSATEAVAMPFMTYAAAAATILLLASAGLNLLLYKSWKAAEQNLALVDTEKSRVAGRMEVQKASYVQALKDLNILKNPELVKMELKGAALAPYAKAMVYCNFKTNEIFLDVRALPAPPDSMQYQFWAIVKGKPIDAGMIDLCKPTDTCGIHPMNPVADAHAFAISLERKGGCVQPEGQIYASFGI